MTTTPEILDLDALDDVDEGKPPFRFRFDGHEYTTESPNRIDVRDLGELVSSQDPAELLAWMIGEDQWAILEAAEKVFTLPLMEKVSSGWLDHHGLDIPKSGGSSRSSRRRAIR